MSFQMTAKKGEMIEYKPVPGKECWGHNLDRLCSEGVYYCSFFGFCGVKHAMFYCMNHIILLNENYSHESDPIVLELYNGQEEDDDLP